MQKTILPPISSNSKFNFLKKYHQPCQFLRFSDSKQSNRSTQNHKLQIETQNQLSNIHDRPSAELSVRAIPSIKFSKTSQSVSPKSDALVDNYLLYKIRDSINQMKLQYPNVQFFNYFSEGDEDYFTSAQQQLNKLRYKIIKICLDHLIYQFLFQKLCIRLFEQQMILNNTMIQLKFYFVFRFFFEKARQILLLIFEQHLEYKELFLQLFYSYVTPKEVQEEIIQSKDQANLKNLLSELDKQVKLQLPITEMIFKKYIECGLSIIHEIVKVELKEENATENQIRKKLWSELDENPYDAIYVVTLQDQMIKAIFEKDFSFYHKKKKKGEFNFHYHVSIDKLKEQVGQELKYDSNLLLYQEFADILAEEIILKSNNEIFNIMIKELGSPLDTYRSIITRYEMFIDENLQPLHVVKMAQKLELAGKEYDNLWIAYLGCIFLLKYSRLANNETIMNILSLEIPHLEYFKYLVKVNRLKRQFFFQKLQGKQQLQYFRACAWFRFFKDQSEIENTDENNDSDKLLYYYYNFESREKKDEITFKDQVLIKKYSLMEKENLIRIVLGLNYLLYGEEFNLPQKLDKKE